MTKSYRLILMILSITILLLIGYQINKDFSFVVEQFWFAAGFLLLILLSLIDQPHFTTESSVFINSVTAGVSLLLVTENNKDWIYHSFFYIVIFLIITSYILLWLREKQNLFDKKLIQIVNKITKYFGRPNVIFSAFFIWGAVKQFGINSSEFNALLWFWIIFTILNIPELSKTISSSLTSLKIHDNGMAIGYIFGVQSKNTFLVKLLENKPTVKLYDFVEFKYSVDKSIRKGLLLDVYLLNQEQWVKVLSNNEIESIFKKDHVLQNHNSDVVYKIPEIPNNEYLSKFVGIVTENSTIGKIRFIYNSKVKIEDGQLIEIIIDDNKILYQIVEGITKIEQLENKNQTGNIIVEAIQLGTWNKDNCRFEPYGWVPEINSPTYLAENTETYEFKQNEIQVGVVPNTNYPVVLNKELSITHHTAILGVTGTGKTTFARFLIENYINTENTKIICVDFTKEYKDQFTKYEPESIINDERNEKIFKEINWRTKELEKFGNQQDKDKLKEADNLIKQEFKEAITEFLNNDKKLAIFELPDITNTIGVLDYTRDLFKELFQIAKEEKCFGKRVSVVLEEAHTIIPEWNFIGLNEKNSQALVNQIGQIALQGRKYDIGFLVIAQRTANVSKTVLTQCNTVIAFQEFDKTSSDFLSNYFGQDIIKILPTLKFRHAIAAGKAFKSSVPMIFEVPEM